MRKRGFKLKYPKFTLLFLTFIFAYILFSAKIFLPLRSFLLSLGYLGIFVSGIFYSYSFTSASATASLLFLSNKQNIFLAGLLGGLGALISDLIIFNFIKFSFKDEIIKLSKEKIFNFKKKKSIFQRYFLIILGGLIIASPLPDEIGVSLMALSKKVSTRLFILLSYFLNSIGIMIILTIGELL